MEALMARANEGSHSEFEFVRSLSNLLSLNVYARGIKRAIKAFRLGIRACWRLYSEQIRGGSQDLDAIVALRQFRKCERFYKDELAILRDMKKEYRAYVFGGHIWDTLVGKERSESDLVDYRKLPFKLF